MVELESFRDARKALRTKLRSAQERCWTELFSAVDSDPWGLPYRIVTKHLSRQHPGTAARGRESTIADTLFPVQPQMNWQTIPAFTE